MGADHGLDLQGTRFVIAVDSNILVYAHREDAPPACDSVRAPALLGRRARILGHSVAVCARVHRHRHTRADLQPADVDAARGGCGRVVDGIVNARAAGRDHGALVETDAPLDPWQGCWATSTRRQGGGAVPSARCARTLDGGSRLLAFPRLGDSQPPRRRLTSTRPQRRCAASRSTSSGRVARTPAL